VVPGPAPRGGLPGPAARLRGDKDKKDDDKKEEKKDKDKGKDKKDGKEKKDDDKKSALLSIDGELTDADPMDKKLTNSHAKTFRVKLAEGKTYRIDMTSKKVDSFLRLEDADGDEVATDDDGGGFPNARIVYKARKAGEYKVIATTFEPGKTGEATGKFTLTVREASKGELLMARAGNYPRVPASEQKEIMAELRAHLEEKGADIKAEDAQPALQIAISTEFGPNRNQAAKTYKEFSKLLAASADPKVAETRKMLDGAVRRLGLVGKAMEVKGKTLEGKDFDWSKYKGKVVLVDFWATWCGPCVGEVPNMKKMYEAYHDRGFEIVGISIDNDKAAPTKFMKNKDLPWVCLFDGTPRTGEGELAAYYGIFSIPQAILVDRDGKVVSLSARGQELDRLLEKHIGPNEKSEKKADPNRDLE